MKLFIVMVFSFCLVIGFTGCSSEEAADVTEASAVEAVEGEAEGCDETKEKSDEKADHSDCEGCPGH